MGGVCVGPHCRIRMRETVNTGEGLGAECREHFLACSYIFWVRWWQNEQRTLGLLKIRLSHQISCKHHSRSILESFKYQKYHHNTSHLLYLHHTIDIFPSIGLSYWKLNFLTPKTSWTSQRKACGCGKLPHDTRRVFLCMRVRTRQCEHFLFIHVWAFGAGPAVRARTRQCECTFSEILSLVFPWEQYHSECTSYMMSSNGSFFHVTGPLYGKFTCHQWIPLTNGQLMWTLMWVHISC